MSARILIVDDMPANTRLLEAKLSAEYYQVATAQDGFEGLRLAHSWQPDLVLLDVMMPGMDGYETCRRLRTIRTRCTSPSSWSRRSGSRPSGCAAWKPGPTTS